MARGLVDAAIVGADRIAANGDVANKIGTYPLAVLAERHGVPFYVAAPQSTIDPDTPSGDAIPIEERAPGEVTPRRAVPARNFAFDVTPVRAGDGDRHRGRRAEPAVPLNCFARR